MNDALASDIADVWNAGRKSRHKIWRLLKNNLACLGMVYLAEIGWCLTCNWLNL